VVHLNHSEGLSSIGFSILYQFKKSSISVVIVIDHLSKHAVD